MTLGAFTLPFGVTHVPGSGARFGVADAVAQETPELAAARSLFTEALADETAQRYAPALQKFLRVQAVRDTQAVRYRIATCLEALGRLRAALEAYTGASIAAGTDAESVSIARVSRDKMDALSRRVGRVVVKLSSRAPDDAAVKIDGEVLAPNAIGTPIVVDPGVHEIAATGTGAVPFHAQATVAEGGTATIEVPIDAPRRAAALPVKAMPVATPPDRAPLVAAPPVGEQEETISGRSAAGVVGVTAGGVLIAGSIVLLLVRHADIETLDGACPGGLCPVSQESQLTATRSRALIEGPLAIGVGAAGLVATGVGIVLLATPSSSQASSRAPSSAFAPWIDRDARGLAWSGRF